jgi:hypothetical protein
MGLGDIITRFFAREVKSVSGLELPNVDLNPQPKPKKPKKEKPVKRTLALVILALAATLAVAQTATTAPTVQNFYAGGVSYSVNASPDIAGTGLYAHLLGSTGTYAFTAVDALTGTTKPFTVTTNIGAGVAQKLGTYGKVSFYVPTSAGISWNGSNTGWQWNSGAIATIPIKNNWYIAPTVRFLKSSVSNGSGYQPMFTVLVGYGK